MIIQAYQKLLKDIKLVSRFPLLLDYFSLSLMILHFWKSINLAVTDMFLPPSLLAPFKRELGDELHSLKYIIFKLPQKNNQSEQSEVLDEILRITDAAKRYNLNQNEFQTACRIFAQNNGRKEVSTSNNQKRIQPFKRRIKTALLPMPRIGTTLYRMDPRRKGLCKIVQIDPIKGTVVWQHSGRKSTVLIDNLRNPALYSMKRVYQLTLA